MGWGRWKVGAALVFLVAVPGTARAQLPVSGWVRPLLAVPVGDFAGRDKGVAARASVGLDVGAAITLGALRVYGEYQEVGFGCGECAEAMLDDSALDRGWGAGVVVPLFGEPYGLVPWARLGVIGHHLRFRSEDESAYSDRSLGWAAGFGAEIRPLNRILIEPAILFRSYDASFGFAIDVPDRNLSISYLSFGLGLTIEL